MFDIPVNAKVECSDGHAGTSTYIIVNPVNQEVSYVVVQEFIHSSGTERMVPIAAVKETSPNKIELSITKEKLTKLPTFVEDFYIQNVPSETDAADVYLEPFVTPLNMGMTQVETASYPSEGIVLRRGMSIEATDGFVGKIRELIVDPIDHKVTHVLLHKGHLWGAKNIMIPLANIDRIDADTIFLNIDKTAVKELEDFSIKRHYEPPQEDEEETS